MPVAVILPIKLGMETRRRSLPCRKSHPQRKPKNHWACRQGYKARSQFASSNEKSQQPHRDLMILARGTILTLGQRMDSEYAGR